MSIYIFNYQSLYSKGIPRVDMLYYIVSIYRMIILCSMGGGVGIYQKKCYVYTKKRRPFIYEKLSLCFKPHNFLHIYIYIV